MSKWNPLNMELRADVIGKALRLEQTSSSLIRSMLRMFNEKSKTLGNQSSALSFKSKIDLLYDLEEIDTSIYSHLLKIMEIRNQFAHNCEATSFEELDSINSSINVYLTKFIPEHIDKDTTREKKLASAFDNLFKISAGRLLVLEIEYTKGLKVQILNHINNIVVDNIETIFENARSGVVSNKLELGIPGRIGNEIEIFKNQFRIALYEFRLAELDKIKDKDELRKIFKQKMFTEDILKEIENDAQL